MESAVRSYARGSTGSSGDSGCRKDPENWWKLYPEDFADGRRLQRASYMSRSFYFWMNPAAVWILPYGWNCGVIWKN
jgi:hypothetical protein